LLFPSPSAFIAGMKTPVLTLTVAILAASLGVLSAADKDAAPKKKAPKKNPAMMPVEDVPGLPRVLLIGDSISIGYTVPVRKKMEGVANVHRPLTNCGPTTRGLEGIDEWLGDGKWDVIHFNWGLHDLKYMGADGSNLADPKDSASHQQVPPAEYEKNLRELVAKLKATDAKLIWRNTTPVPEGAGGRVVGDSKKYNEIAAKVMEENDIHIHDMYSFVMPRIDEIMRPANVHFTPEGSDALADTVVAEIKAALAAK